MLSASLNKTFPSYLPIDRIIYTIAFVTPVMEHWLEREITLWVLPMKDQSDDPSHHERTLIPRSYISFLERWKTRCHHIGYSFWLTARILLYASSHRQDNIHHSLCYTSHGALAGTRNSYMGPLWRINPTTHCSMSEHSYHRATSRSPDV